MSSLRVQRLACLLGTLILVLLYASACGFFASTYCSRISAFSCKCPAHFCFFSYTIIVLLTTRCMIYWKTGCRFQFRSFWLQSTDRLSARLTRPSLLFNDIYLSILSIISRSIQHLPWFGSRCIAYAFVFDISAKFPQIYRMIYGHIFTASTSRLLA